jgi:hypothetical protein
LYFPNLSVFASRIDNRFLGSRTIGTIISSAAVRRYLNSCLLDASRRLGHKVSYACPLVILTSRLCRLSLWQCHHYR